MICTSELPCLSSDLAKNDRVMSMFVLFPGFFGHFEILGVFFENSGTNITPKQSNMIF